MEKLDFNVIEDKVDDNYQAVPNESDMQFKKKQKLIIIGVIVLLLLFLVVLLCGVLVGNNGEAIDKQNH